LGDSRNGVPEEGAFRRETSTFPEEPSPAFHRNDSGKLDGAMPAKLIAGLANALGANATTTEVAIAAAQGIPIRCRFGFLEITFQVS
jgi:hypothetical protein